MPRTMRMRMRMGMGMGMGMLMLMLMNTGKGKGTGTGKGKGKGMAHTQGMGRPMQALTATRTNTALPTKPASRLQPRRSRMCMAPVVAMIMGMTMATGMATDTPNTLLQLMWLASPALPVGGFSYSEGLEAAVEGGHVSSEALASDWLVDQLHLSLARADLPVLARACVAWHAHDGERLMALNDWLRQTRETAELRAQAEQMGRSLLDWLRNSAFAGDPRIKTLAALHPAPLWPVAFALAAELANATPLDALTAFAWGWAENMAQAAMKAVPLGQAGAQRILSRLAAAIPQACAGALQLPDGERQAATPMLAILSAQHEVQYSRLFRS
jgi:urease accessory protein